MVLVKIEEGTYVNPIYVAFIAKQPKIGHHLDQDPEQPHDNVIKMMSGDIIVVKTNDVEGIAEKINSFLEEE